MEETISLKELFAILRKRLVMILVITIGAALVSAIVSFYFITPIYQTSTQILVNQKKQDEKIIQYNEVQTNVQLTNTYKIIVKSPVILDRVKSELKLGMSTQELNGKINVENEKDSQVIAVTVQDKDVKLARDIANTTAEIFKSEIAKIMSIDNVTILSKAEVAEGQSPIKPNKKLNIAIAFVVGLMASVGIAFLLEYLDNTLKKEEDIEKLLAVPVLGVVSHMEEDGTKSGSLSATKRVGGHTIGS
ncbi:MULTISPECIES: YveK family protein [Bacillus]|uniref:Wzz/FepE/Etk N-terminal domain-containing protein n=1 Tax=Bacillus paramycoides TaxID=2026194 RepID=A0ABU6MSH9_9BACI|nr:MULTISPECIES: Wzz/FepE/Etk N-terminal domain-containing protein [Bacillus]PFD42961.1 capsular biosynthesis protein [Bacillus cereus]KMN46578.1 capsular biosynthesis protein [Bacillus sp. LK2]MED0960090.1 Wzz/FepE/Etk N-terminal domain-containing protein [Bacillus paramycoides]MED1104021.1 Wzz/FepE/Etk N-terminal domain-containing protein [Bacillus paramycoides]MED1565117.1 Wzz/FepE/Etk N-terminal domain-containing protein [Bacillus paramycoides]